jgi:hypothetical protein
MLCGMRSRKARDESADAASEHDLPARRRAHVPDARERRPRKWAPMTAVAPTMLRSRGRALKPNGAAPVVAFTTRAEPAAWRKLRETGLAGFEAFEAETLRPVDSWWRDIAAREHHVEIAGPSTSGKSTLAFLLAAASASTVGPVPVLGHDVVPVEPSKFVLFIEEENSTRSTASNMIAACQMLGLDPRTTLDRVVVLARKGVVAHQDTEGQRGLTLWSHLLESGKAGLVGRVFLDSRARIFRAGDSNDEASQAIIAEHLHHLMRVADASVVLVSHTRKSGSGAIEDLSGSAQRGAGADCILLVTAERDGGRVLRSQVVFAKLRDGGLEHPPPVTFSIAKRAEGWTLAINASADERDQPAHERIHERLCNGGEASKKQLREALGMSAATVEAGLTVLFGEKRITTTMKRVRGQTVKVFRFVPEHELDKLLRTGRRAATEDE